MLFRSLSLAVCVCSVANSRELEPYPGQPHSIMEEQLYVPPNCCKSNVWQHFRFFKRGAQFHKTPCKLDVRGTQQYGAVRKYMLLVEKVTPDHRQPQSNPEPASKDDGIWRKQEIILSFNSASNKPMDSLT